MTILARARAAVRWPTQRSVPLRGSFNVFLDGDLANAINPAPIAAWPDGEGRIGWGLGDWGVGRWGMGDVPRWGNGTWGVGTWGFPQRMLQHVTPKLRDATYDFGVVGYDAAGNPAAPGAATEATATLAGTPNEPGAPTADDYDDGTDALTLGWPLSSDDEESPKYKG